MIKIGFQTLGQGFVELATVGCALAVLAAVSATQLGYAPLTVALTAYLAWNGFQLFRFREWLRRPKKAPQPIPIGIWKAILIEANRLREREKSHKKRLRDILGGFQESTGALPDATVVLNEQWEIEWFNPVASELLGIDKTMERGGTIFTCIDDAPFRAYVEAGDYARPLQMPAPADYGVTLEVRVVKYGKGKCLIQARDVTRLQQLEIVRRDFVANVSHELRTPLTVIHGYLETLLDADDDDELDQWKPILAHMTQQSTRLQRIVEDLLLLSRLETRERAEGMEVVHVAPLLERVAADARTLGHESDHELTVECEDGLDLFANRSEIESAFSNLVVNAVRYTPPGGRIALRWRREGEEAWFSVADTGVGIDALHVPRLTERFYRVDVGRSREKGGTGLGLAIVKHILLRHGAWLRIESRPEEGSTFTCCFPDNRVRVGQPGSPDSAAS